MENPDKNIYLLAGDVSGNPDAISAFYDRDHITFLASGMGEVADENYLLIHVFKGDSTDFELAPLNAELSLPGIEYYSVPHIPASISGPGFVFQGSRSIEYLVPEVFNAESYLWGVPLRASGSSAATFIPVQADYTSIEAPEGRNPAPLIKVLENGSMLVVECSEVKGEHQYPAFHRENCDQVKSGQGSVYQLLDP